MIFPSSFLLLSFLDPTLLERAPDEGGGVEVVQLIKVEKRRQVCEHLVSYPVPGQTFSTFCKSLDVSKEDKLYSFYFELSACYGYI